MNKTTKEIEISLIKYFFLVFCMIFFVVLYVWQNISVMELKMDYRRRVKVREKLITENDRLLYEIEKNKRIDKIEQYVVSEGMVPIVPVDFRTIKIKD